MKGKNCRREEQERGDGMMEGNGRWVHGKREGGEKEIREVENESSW